MLLIWWQAQEKCKFLWQFTEGWPVCDFMSRYLWIHVAQCKVTAKESQTDKELNDISDKSDKQGSDANADSESDSEDDLESSDIEEDTEEDLQHTVSNKVSTWLNSMDVLTK